MTKEFIPYEEALALKKLGFDECCCAYYLKYNNKKDLYYILPDSMGSNNSDSTNDCTAPTYSQAFRWFRDEHGLHAEITFDVWNTEEYSISILKKGDKEFHFEAGTGFKEYSDAEKFALQCLIKINRKHLKNEVN